MSVDREKLMAKIRALIAKSESTTYETEKEAFWAKANELIEQYQLDLAEVMQSGEDADGVLKIKHLMYRICKSKSEVKDWKISLAGAVGSFLDLKVFVIAPYFVMPIGREIDLEIWVQMYESLLNQLETAREKDIEVEKARGRVGMKTGTHPRTWRQLYSTAAVSTISGRIIQLKRMRSYAQHWADAGKRLLNPGQQNAIVLVKEKTDEMVRDYMKKEFDTDKTTTYVPNHISLSDPRAVVMGHETGHRVKIQEGLEKGDEKKSLPGS